MELYFITIVQIFVVCKWPNIEQIIKPSGHTDPYKSDCFLLNLLLQKRS